MMIENRRSGLGERRAPWGFVCMVATLLATSPSPAGGEDAITEASGPIVVARVGADSITAAQVTAQTERMSAQANEDGLVYRHRLLSPLIHRLLLRNEARRRGLFDDPTVEAELERARASELRRRLIEREVEAKATPTPDELVAEFRRRAADIAGDPARERMVESTLAKTKRDSLQNELDTGMIEEFGLQLDHENIAAIAAKAMPFDARFPEHYEGPVLRLAPSDTNLVLYRTLDDAYTVRDLLAGPASRRSQLTSRWVQDPQALEQELTRIFLDRASVVRAERLGLDDADDFQRWLEFRREEFAVTRLYEEVVARSRPTDREVRAYYEANLERYTQRERIEVDAWVVTDSTLARQLERGFESGLPETVLRNMAEESGALQDEFNQKLLREQIERTTGPLQAGDTVSIVRPERSFVYRILAIEPASAQPFDEVAIKVRREVEDARAEEAFREFLDNLRARVPVEIDEEALAKVPI